MTFDTFCREHYENAGDYETLGTEELYEVYKFMEEA